MRNRLVVVGAIVLSTAICATVTPRQTARIERTPLAEEIQDAGTAKGPTFENASTVKKQTRATKNEPVAKKETTTEITLASLASYEELFSPSPDRDCTVPDTYWGQMMLLAQERFVWLEQNQGELGRLISTAGFSELYEVLGRPTSESVLEATHPLNDIILFLASTRNPNENLKSGIMRYINLIPDMDEETKGATVDAIKRSYVCELLDDTQGRRTDSNVDDALVVFGIIGLPPRCE